MSTQVLPPGWSEHTTDNGTLYYHHQNLGTQWEFPTPQDAGIAFDDDHRKPRGNEGGRLFAGFSNAIGNPMAGLQMSGLINEEGDSNGSYFSRFAAVVAVKRLNSVDFMMRCMAVFTGLKSLFSGSFVIGKSFEDSPDLYGPFWITSLGCFMGGFLPSICEAVVCNKPVNFNRFLSSFIIFGLFHACAVVVYGLGYDAQRRNPLFGGTGNILGLVSCICTIGYSSVVLIVLYPALMIGSWLFRLLIMGVITAFQFGFLAAVMKGSASHLGEVPSPKKMQLITAALCLSLINFLILVTLPRYDYVDSYIVHMDNVDLYLDAGNDAMR